MEEGTTCPSGYYIVDCSIEIRHKYTAMSTLSLSIVSHAYRERGREPKSTTTRPAFLVIGRLRIEAVTLKANKTLSASASNGVRLISSPEVVSIVTVCTTVRRSVGGH